MSVEADIVLSLMSTDLWTAPMEMGNLLDEGRGITSQPGCRLDGGIPSAGVPRSRCRTLPPLSVEGWGRQQHSNIYFKLQN